MSPERAILIQSPGRKPWVNHRNTFIEPQRGLLHNTAEINTRAVVPLLKELILCFVSVYPGFHFGLCPHFTLGFEEVSCLRHSILPPQINHTPPRTHSYLTIHAIPISTGYPFKSNNTPILAMSPLGRYLFRAQGASPGLIIGTHLLSPKGAALSSTQ